MNPNRLDIDIIDHDTVVITGLWLPAIAADNSFDPTPYAMDVLIDHDLHPWYDGDDTPTDWSATLDEYEPAGLDDGYVGRVTLTGPPQWFTGPQRGELDTPYSDPALADLEQNRYEQALNRMQP